MTDDCPYCIRTKQHGLTVTTLCAECATAIEQAYGWERKDETQEE